MVIRVGVQRGREQSVGRAHLAEEPADRLFADVDVERVAVTGPGLGVGAEQLGVIVEHLLEVRHRPVAVHAVAMEAAADLVEESAAGHGTEGDGQDGVDARREGAVRFDRGGSAQAEQEVKRVRGGELRRGAEAAEGVVMLLADAAGGRDEVVRHRRAPVGVGRPGEVRQVLRDGVGVRGELGLVAMVEVRDAHQQLRPRDLAVAAVLGREIRAAEERTAVGQAEAVEGPAAVALDHLHGVHHQLVDFGPFLAVDLDAHEVLVHQVGDPGLFERLAGHHVAPVTGRVADGHQDGLVLGLGLRESLGAPRPPMHGVGLVLAEVEGAFVGQAIRHDSKVGILGPGATKTVSKPFDLQGRGRGAKVSRCLSSAPAASSAVPSDGPRPGLPDHVDHPHP